MELSLKTKTENVIAQRKKPVSDKTLIISMVIASLLGFTVPLTMGYVGIAVLGLWGGPLTLSLVTQFENIRDKGFAKKIRRHLQLHKHFYLSPRGTHYFENRDGRIISLESLEAATTSEVYCATETEFAKVVIQRDPMELWDNSLGSVKSIYELAEPR